MGAGRAKVEMGLLAGACVLLAGALAVRGIEGAPALAPQDRPRASDAIAEPMQLVGRGASLRFTELDARVNEPLRARWKATSRLVYSLAGCPELGEWLDAADGQECERLLGDLRRGTGDEALAALALTFELARATDWETGLLARTQNAERLGALLQEWLRAWGARSADDATLAEPALAALCVYGRVMNIAAEAPPVGRFAAPYERAVAFLDTLLVEANGQPTKLATALRARFPSAANAFEENDDRLRGLESEAARMYPELDGDCES